MNMCQRIAGIGLLGASLMIASGFAASAQTRKPPAASSSATASAIPASARVCIRASGLNDASFAPSPLRFSNAMGMDANLVAGVHATGPHKGRPAMVLCLYNRKTGHAEVRDAAPWMSRNQPWVQEPKQKK